MTTSKSPDRKGQLATAPTSSFSRTVRETLESVVIALILAFMFRAFEAEAFVIPTGSMAPTLQGVHKDLECPKCHIRYRVSASSESEEYTKPELVIAGTCPNCRYTVESLDDQQKYPPYNGDKILVGKFPPVLFPETFGEPQRWEVIVFRFPENAKQNYIKRLIGLPGEIVRVEHGDIYISRDNGGTFHLERKPPHKVRAMLQLVYDNDYLSDETRAGVVPLRWQSPTPSGLPLGAVQAAAWTADDGGRAFQVSAGEAPSWLRYQHCVPTYLDWKIVEKQGSLPANRVVQPQLISDFYAYNTAVTYNPEGNPPPTGLRGPNAMALGVHWVGDLAMEFDLHVEQPAGEVTCELVKGGHTFQCRLDLNSGAAKLVIDDGQSAFGEEQAQTRPLEVTAATKVHSPGKHHVAFANVDERLLVWLDGSLLEFDGPTAYASLKNYWPTRADLSPVSIAARGASVKVSGLRVERDVYYVATASEGKAYPDSLSVADQMGLLGQPPHDYLEPRLFKFERSGDPVPAAEIAAIRDAVNARANWSNERGLAVAETAAIRNALFARPQELDAAMAKRVYVDFPLASYPNNPDEDQFFVMGDNSPQSSDARMWGVHFVPRKMLIGKALYIYWPASHDVIPGLNISFPFFPNFGSMGFVR